MIKYKHALFHSELDAVRELMIEFLEWAKMKFHPELDGIPAFDAVDDELNTLPDQYAPPQGRLFLALVDDQPAGCVGMRPVDDGIAELKRMYVRPAFRGMKIGWTLGQMVVDAAKEAGYHILNLDSHKLMTDAHRVYYGLGFQVVPTPDDMPPFVQENAIFMALDLTSSGDSLIESHLNNDFCVPVVTAIGVLCRGCVRLNRLCV